MKSMRKYTIRGEITAGDVKRIQLFDGRYDTGYQLNKFIITPQRILESEKVTCKLMTEEKAHGVNWFWARQSEIGWAAWNTPSNLRYGQFSQVDHEAIVVEDLFIDATGDSGEVLGDIQFSTVGHTSGDSYTIWVEIKKTGGYEIPQYEQNSTLGYPVDYLLGNFT